MLGLLNNVSIGKPGRKTRKSKKKTHPNHIYVCIRVAYIINIITY